MTALHWAAYNGHEALAQGLLGAGADINATNAVPTTKTHALLFIIFVQTVFDFFASPPLFYGRGIFFLCVYFLCICV
jgi:ankyrin repeat protein